MAFVYFFHYIFTLFCQFSPITILSNDTTFVNKVQYFYLLAVDYMGIFSLSCITGSVESPVFTDRSRSILWKKNKLISILFITKSCQLSLKKQYYSIPNIENRDDVLLFYTDRQDLVYTLY